jgi:hypothetical protein
MVSIDFMVVRRLRNLDPIDDLSPRLITVEPVLCVKRPFDSCAVVVVVARVLTVEEDNPRVAQLNGS